MVVCQDVVPKASPNDRVRAEGPNEKPSAADMGTNSYEFRFVAFRGVFG